MIEVYANNFATALSEDCGVDDTTISVETVAPGELQDGQFRIRIDSEYMIVTAGQSGQSWTVTRGAESSTEAEHDAGAEVYHLLTAGAATGFEQQVNKGQVGGYAGLEADPTTGDAVLEASQVPSVVVMDTSADGPTVGQVPVYTGNGRETSPGSAGGGSVTITSPDDSITIGGTNSEPTVELSSAFQSDISDSAPLTENVNHVSTSGSSQTIPSPTEATINYLVLTEDCVLTFPTPVAGQSFTLELEQDITGGWDVTWPTAVILWVAGLAPTLATASTYRNLFSFVCVDGTYWEGIQASTSVGYTVPSYGSILLGMAPTYFWETTETSGTTAADSADSNPGTYSDCTLAQAGPAGIGDTGVLFNGTSSYIETANTVATPTDAFSIAFWFKTSSSSMGLVTLGTQQTPSDTEPSQLLAIYVDSNGDLNFAIISSDSTLVDLTSTDAVTDDVWHLFVGTMATDGAMTLYLDGREVASNTNTYAIYSDSYIYWCLGWLFDDGRFGVGTGSDVPLYFDGDLSSIAVWESTELTADDVTTLYNSGS